jgi:hypothetical protein
VRAQRRDQLVERARGVSDGVENGQDSWMRMFYEAIRCSAAAIMGS